MISYDDDSDNNIDNNNDTSMIFLNFVGIPECDVRNSIADHYSNKQVTPCIPHSYLIAHLFT